MPFSASDPQEDRAFRQAFEIMTPEEQAQLHDEARGRALREDPTLKGSPRAVDETIWTYMREIWEERQATRE